jgi:hypothetical protein
MSLKKLCDRPSLTSFWCPCRVNGWHGGDMSHRLALSLSNLAGGTAYREFAQGRTPKLCSYVSFAFGLISNAPTTFVDSWVCLDRARSNE